MVTLIGQKFTRCPKAWLRDSAAWTAEPIREWAWLRDHGVMPRAGGLDDQLVSFVAATEICDAAAAEVAEAMRAKAAAGKEPSGG
jgi:hypothetical protein